MESSSNSKGCLGQFLAYVRTYKGAILAAEIVACIIIMICFGASWTKGYMGLSISMLIYTTVIFIIFMCSLHTQMTFIHWGWTDFLRTLIGAVAFLITSLIVLIQHHDGAGIAAGVFGLLTALLFGFDAYITFPKLKQANPSPVRTGGSFFVLKEMGRACRRDLRMVLFHILMKHHAGSICYSLPMGLPVGGNASPKLSSISLLPECLE
ncbi:hypothetical protein lerEdw1_005505 [Lerista edwardsae]|nr:hypothetical protein lerEdw1_005505 [Lerista edwardsae]